MDPRIKTLISSLAGMLLAIAAFIPAASHGHLWLLGASAVLGNLSSIFAGRTGPKEPIP